MEDIKQVRFEALAAYCRQPGALIAGKEVRWLKAYDEEVLVVLIRDVTDGDYSAILFARDLKERYRWVGMTTFFETVDEALAAAPGLVEKIHADFGVQRAQGDEKGKASPSISSLLSWLWRNSTAISPLSARLKGIHQLLN